jgi:hypothetical protein
MGTGEEKICRISAAYIYHTLADAKKEENR